MTRYYLEIHMKSIGFANISQPNLIGWSTKESLTSYKDRHYVSAPDNLMEYLDLTPTGYFNENHLEDVLVNYSIVPIFYNGKNILRGWVDI